MLDLIKEVVWGIGSLFILAALVKMTFWSFSELFNEIKKIGEGK